MNELGFGPFGGHIGFPISINFWASGISTTGILGNLGSLGNLIIGLAQTLHSDDVTKI